MAAFILPFVGVIKAWISIFWRWFIMYYKNLLLFNEKLLNYILTILIISKCILKVYEIQKITFKI